MKKILLLFLSVALLASVISLPICAAESSTSEVSFRMGTYNILEGGYYEQSADGAKQPTFDLIAQDIATADLDVICLQEIENNSYMSGGIDDVLGTIASKLKTKTGKTYYYQFGQVTSGTYTQEKINELTNQLNSNESWGRPLGVTVGDTWTNGVGILSIYPIQSSQVHFLTEGTAPNNRGFLECVLNVNGRDIPVYATHCEQGIIKTQMREMYEIVKDKRVFLIGGDFNYPGNLNQFSDIRIAFNHSITIANNAENAMDTTVKYRDTDSDGVHYFDNILAKTGVTIKNVTAKITGHSDHKLLYADITVPADDKLLPPSIEMTSPVTVRGIQRGTDGKSLRLIAEIEGLAYSEAGFEVIITYQDTNSKTQSATQTVQITTAYTKLLENGTNWIEPTKDENYLIAIAIKNIPDDVLKSGNLSVVFTPYATTGSANTAETHYGCKVDYRYASNTLNKWTLPVNSESIIAGEDKHSFENWFN